jgi:hypothetical protein
LRRYLDAIYFMIQSILTVGLGDIKPTSVGTRIGTIIVMPVGIVFIGTALPKPTSSDKLTCRAGLMISQIRDTVLTSARAKFLEKLADKAHELGQEVENRLEKSGLVENHADEDDEAQNLDLLMKGGLSYEESLRAAVRATERANQVEHRNDVRLSCQHGVVSDANP